ncbi:MAG: LamG domain-containing protein [Patescibacteria group bacterium]|nr:LamG domain-containing protein [Patescibacteria group bacterium]
MASPNSYNYTVIAGNIGGENSDSAGPIAVSWCDAPAPSDFVLSQVCDGLGNSNVDLIWNQDAPENVSHYIIDRYNSDVGITDILESSLDSSLRTYLDDSPPFDETNYDYSIVAVGNSGNYATSTQSILTNDCALPGVPNITIYNPSCNGVAPFIDLSWTNIANADYYVVSQDGSDIFDTRNKIAALYHFDEGSGIDIEDATEIKENGSIVSGTPQWVAGKIGNALDFSNGRRVEIPDSDNSVFDFKNCFTLEAWVNSEGSSSRDYVIYKDSVYYFTIYNNKINWYLYNAHCGNDCWSARCHIDTGVNINVNEWTHIAMVYDKNTVTIYKNGNEEIASFPAYGLVYPVNNNPVRIGYSFQGAIDEVKVVGEALGPAEILADYNDGNTGINLTVPLAGDVVDFDDYNVLANDDPWYLGESHTYEVTAFNLGGSATSVSETATFDNPTDACVPGVSYQTDTSAYCISDNPGVSYPYIHFEWGDFMPGNSGISNADVRTSSAYRLVIDSVLKADVLPTTGTYWCSGGRREHVYFQNDISGWGIDDDANHSISLRITNVNGLTQDSSVRDINIPFCAAPSDVTNFTVTPGCNGDQAKADLDWDDDSLGYTNSYYVVREKQGGGTEPTSLNYEGEIEDLIDWNYYNEGLCYKDGIFYRTSWYNHTGGELVDSNGISYDTESWSNDLNGIVWDSVDNCFWFSDDQHNDIVKTDENFNFISRFDISGEIYSQRGITTDGTYLYIVDSGHYEDYRYSGAIFVYNKDGSLHKKIDMSLMAHGSWNGHGIAYLNGYLYVGTDGGVHYESVYAINVSQIADGIVSIQAIFDTSSYVCSYGVKGVATDGSNLFLADYCYTPFYKFSIVKSGNEIKYVNTALVSEYENFGDLEVNSAYDYYILATGNNYSYNISATIATTTPSACYNAPLEPSVSYVTPKCDNSANSYMEVKWNAIVEENNTDDYDLYRIDDLLNNDIIINGIGDNNFGSLTSGSDNCSSIIDIDSGLLVITCEDYELILTTGYKYYLKANGPGGTVQSIDYPLDFVNPIDCNATPEIPANFSVASDCMGYCNGGNDNGNFCAGDSDCDSADCTISFLNGGSENLKWDRMQNAFQYVISRYCDGTYDNTITIGEIGYSSYDPDNPDVSYFDTYVKYIDHIPFEFINKDCLYTVIAKGYGGDSDPTDLLGDTVPVCGNTPAAPTNLDLSNIKCDETTISWSDITDIGEVGNDPPNNPGTGGEFYYNVYQDYDFTGPVLIAQKLSPINSGETQTFSATGLVEEKNYSWLIEAWNPAGTSTSTISTITAKCGPQNLVLKRKLSSCEKVELYWKRAENYLGFENAKRYEVYRAESISNIFDDVQYLGNSCSGDFDDDGKVDGHDLIDMNWQIANNADCSSLPCIGDLDGDNDVDSNDQNEFDSQYGRRDCLLKDYDCSDGACYRNINLIIGCSVYTDPCRGDIDSDGDVDGDDLTIMDAQIATNSDCAVMPCIGDLDGDNDVDNNDRGLLTSELGRGDCSDCDLDCSDGVCYDINTKTYKFIDYYNLNDHSEQFLTGTKYYYIVKGLPVEPAIEHGNSNVLKIQPCPYLPEWRDARPE